MGHWHIAGESRLFLTSAAVPCDSCTADRRGASLCEVAMDAAATTTAAAAEGLSADEIALYDRQLRLWGMEAQNRMRKANILLINVKALGNEIAKNLVLAGIGSLTVLDAGKVTQEDVAAQFFVTEDHIGRNRAEAAAEEIQRLNPRVRVLQDPSKVESKESIFFQQFDVIIATDIPLAIMILLNGQARSFDIPFYTASLHGLIGIAFVDLIKHSYVINVPSLNKEPAPKTIPKTEMYVPLQQSISTSYGKSLKARQARKVSHLLPLSLALLSWNDVHRQYPAESDLNEFFQLVQKMTSTLSLPPTIVTFDKTSEFITQIQGPDLSGIAAVVGGILAQDVLNVLAGREPPLKNWLIFDGSSCDGKIFALIGETNGE